MGHICLDAYSAKNWYLFWLTLRHYCNHFWTGTMFLFFFFMVPDQKLSQKGLKVNQKITSFWQNMHPGKFDPYMAYLSCLWLKRHYTELKKKIKKFGPKSFPSFPARTCFFVWLLMWFCISLIQNLVWMHDEFTCTLHPFLSSFECFGFWIQFFTPQCNRHFPCYNWGMNLLNHRLPWFNI